MSNPAEVKSTRTTTRKDRRRYILHGARIATANGYGPLKCRIIDISAGGARLEVNAVDAAPDEFILLLSRDGRLRRQCTVVWRSEKTIGVRFMPTVPIDRKPIQ